MPENTPDHTDLHATPTATPGLPLRFLWIGLGISLTVHLAVIWTGPADWVLGAIFKQEQGELVTADPESPSIEISLADLPMLPREELEAIDELDEVDELEEAEELEEAQPDRVELPGGTFVFGPEHRPETDAVPDNPDLLSDRNMAARNETDQDLPEGEAYIEGQSEHDVLQVEPPGQPMPPGLLPGDEPTPPDMLDRPPTNDTGDMAAEGDEPQEGRQTEFDHDQQDEAEEHSPGSRESSEVAGLETPGERTVKELGSEVVEDAEVADQANPGRQADPGLADAPELARVRRAIDKVMQQPASTGGQPGMTAMDVVVHRNTETKSKSEGSDELDAAKHPLGKYFRQLRDSIGPRWSSYVQSADTLSGVPQDVVVEFIINKDGSLKSIVSVKSQGAEPATAEEALCEQAVRDAAPFDPLPRKSGLQELPVRFRFIYP